MESVVRASLPASSYFCGEKLLRKRRAGSPPSVLVPYRSNHAHYV